MTHIIGMMDYNQLARERREVAKALIDMGRGGEERNDRGIMTSNDGEDDNKDCKLAAKPTVVDNGGKEGVEETCTALNGVVIEELDAEAVADGGRDNNDFEGGVNDLCVCACPLVMRGVTVKHVLTSTSSPPMTSPPYPGAQ